MDTPKELTASEKIEKLKNEIAAIEQAEIEATKAKFTALPAQVGLTTINELIAALLPYSKGITIGKGRKPGAVDKGSKTPAKSGKKGKRAKISDETRKAVIADLKAGMTAKAIAGKHDVSQPWVNLTKKGAGLTNSKK